MKRILTFLLMLVLLALQPLTVYAQSTSGLRAIFSDTPFFDANSGEDCVNLGATATSTKLSSGKVYILGDSITVTAKAKYEEVFSQHGLTATVNASSSRSITSPGTDGVTGLEAIKTDEAIIADPNTKAIVVALGSNGDNSATTIGQVFSAIRKLTTAKIYWVDTIAIGLESAKTRIKTANTAIYDEARRLGMTTIPWFNTVDPTGSPINPTGLETDSNGYIVAANVHVHPTSAGVNALATLVSNTVVNNSTSSQTVVTGDCNCSVDVSAGLNGNDNFEKTWNFFLKKGLTPNAIAGMMGNLMAESGINPQNIQRGAPFPDGPEMPTEIDKITGQIVPDSSIAGSYGYGIMQWTTASRQQGLIQTAKSLGKLTGDLDAQLQHIWFELGTKFFDDVLAKLQEPNVSLNDASDKVAIDYATPRAVIADPNMTPDTNEARRNGALNARRRFSEEILVKYSGLSGGSALSSLPGSCANITGPGEDTRYIEGFTVYSQIDKSWKNKPYGTSTIGLSGCGPTVMAMIITALTGEAVSPVEAADYATAHKMYIENVGSSWSIAPVLAKHWGLKATPFSNTVYERQYLHKDVGAITAALQAGALIIGAGGGAKPFTTEGHYIVIRGVTSDGKFKIADSYHPDTTEQEWDPEQILSQMSTGSMYAITK